MTGGTRGGTPPVSSERRSAVESACRTWINRLTDPSRRNNLLFFRELREGTLDLSSSSKDAIAALIRPSSPAVKLSELINPAVGAHIPQFKIDPHYIVGNFSFQKMAMVRDLRELLEALVQHDVVRPWPEMQAPRPRFEARAQICSCRKSTPPA